MSKPTIRDGKEAKQYYGIAKICFFIIVFNIFVRVDLWVSIAGLIVLLPYLLQKLLLKKLDIAKYLNLFNHAIDSIKKVYQKPNVSQTQEKTNIQAQEIEPTQSEAVDFVEPSFETIWQDCPQCDFVWNEPDAYQEDHNES